MSDPGFAYAACYCEENVWHLCADPRLTSAGWSPPLADRRALLISNALRSVATWAQRAGDPVVWDYHVVLLARAAPAGLWEVWDLDTRLGLPVPLETWLAGSFRRDAPPPLAPRFRVVLAEDYRARFSSDRSHMLDRQGRPRAPFPPWPAIVPPDGVDLQALLDLARPDPGRVVGLTQLVRAACADAL